MRIDVATIPYCGAPPLPATLLTRWNFDPVLLGGLLLVTVCYAYGTRRTHRTGKRPSVTDQLFFYSGWLLTALALVSPLCPLSVSLFAARAGQHMLLALVCAPLVVAGRPDLAFRSLLGPRVERVANALASTPLAASAVFAVLLWFWHTPAPYAATFASTTVYWLMHFSMFGAAFWLWSGLLDQTPEGAARVIGAGLVSTVQMGLLGALITLAPHALYAPHALTTVAWGLTPLQDQQLGGAIMWVPGCLIFLCVAMLVLGLVMSRDETDLRAARS
jgi:putative membrane protein